MQILDTVETIQKGYFAYYNKRLLAKDITEHLFIVIKAYRDRKLSLKEACNLIHQQLS